MMKPETIEKLKNAGRDSHGRLYDFSGTIFYDMNTMLKVRCKCEGHGSFKVWPALLMTGEGCPSCYTASRAIKVGKREKPGIVARPYLRRRPEIDSKTLNELYKEKYVSIVSEIHSNKYSYEKTQQYTKGTEYITVTCPDHGDFSVWASDHLHGRGCPLCYNKDSGDSKGYLYIYSINDKYLGFGITINLTARNKNHQTSFKSAKATGKLVTLFEGTLKDVTLVEAYLKRNLPIRSSGVVGFISESIHKDYKQELFKLIKKFYVSPDQDEDPNRVLPKITLSTIDLSQFNKE